MTVGPLYGVPLIKYSTTHPGSLFHTLVLGFHFAPKIYHGSTPDFGDGDFVKSEDFTPSFQHNDIRHTYLTSTNLSSYAKTPRPPHTLGVHGPKIPAASQRFVRAEEPTLDVSCNSLQFLSQDSFHVLPSLNQNSPYQGF